MSHFASFDGCTISYRDRGDGPLVILLHGSIVDTALNWEAPGIIDRLVDSGFRVVAPDARGHGASGKPHEPNAYRNSALIRDVTTLLDHLDTTTAALVGYSMGADTALRTAALDRRVGVVVAGGVGGDLADPPDYDPEAVASSIRGNDPAMPSGIGSALADLARSLGGDADALAALFEGVRRQTSPDFSAIQCPTLVIAGSDDDMAGGSPSDLASRLASARSVILPGLDHLGAVFDPQFLDAVIDHLNHHHLPRS